MEKTNYMMTIDDVAQELGVSKQKGYRIIRQLNEELAAAGYMTVQAKVQIPVERYTHSEISSIIIPV